MTAAIWLDVILAVIGVILIPLLALLIRIAMKWTRLEDRVTDIADDLKEIIEDKDRAHAEIMTQMREDRTANNQRLRWLEEHLWKDRRPLVEKVLA